MARRKSNKYHGLTRRDADAVSRNPEIAPQVHAIKRAGGKITKTLPGKKGTVTVIFCPTEGRGNRTAIKVGAGDVVREGLIRRKLARRLVNSTISPA